VLAAIQRLRQQLPFPLRGIDADNDPAFMNALMEQWCDAPEQAIELTRSRAYQSNDQAWVEQKNGMLIRRVVGYERLVGLEAARHPVAGWCSNLAGCARHMLRGR
jgi:hypothetical protein